MCSSQSLDLVPLTLGACQKLLSDLARNAAARSSAFLRASSTMAISSLIPCGSCPNALVGLSTLSTSLGIGLEGTFSRPPLARRFVSSPRRRRREDQDGLLTVQDSNLRPAAIEGTTYSTTTQGQGQHGSATYPEMMGNSRSRRSRFGSSSWPEPSGTASAYCHAVQSIQLLLKSGESATPGLRAKADCEPELRALTGAATGRGGGPFPAPQRSSCFAFPSAQRRALELGFLAVALALSLVGALDRRGGLGEHEDACAAASDIWSSAVFEVAMVSQAWW